MMKKCIGCELEFPYTLEFFYKNSTSKSGLTTRCRKCSIDSNKAWRNANHEKMNEYVKCWHNSNPERVREIKRNWYLRNKHRPIDRDSMNARRRERAREEPWIRLHSNISRALRDSIKFRKNITSWQSILGYGDKELIRHMERQFSQEMTWENYGSYWHIDHIVPLSSFPKAMSTDDPNLKSAWALSNLRPLPCRDNQEKHAKRIFLI